MLKPAAVVVGSGASGVEFALALLKKGYRVTMLDTGNTGSMHPEPERTFNGLKQNLEDPARYLLGENFQGVVLPAREAPYYSFPPGKKFVFDTPDRFRYQSAGISPLFSFAAGGLAEAWTGGSYPFRDDDLTGFPFSYRDLAPHYGAVAQRIGVSGVADDDLAEFFPAHHGLQLPLPLDEHSQVLLDCYARKRSTLNSRHGCYVGRSRVAALSAAVNGRAACSSCGRCQWGCPSGALYTPALGLADCRKSLDFTYMRRLYVDHFQFDSAGRVKSVVAYSLDDNSRHVVPTEMLALAAGTLCSSNILLRSVYLDSGERLQLSGLMDNRQILMPFVNLRMIGRQYDPNTYQYHQIAIGMTGDGPGNYVHGLVTTLKTAIVHPVIQSLPFDLATSTAVFRNIRAALGLVNINFPDTPRADNFVALDTTRGSQGTRLVVHYAPEDNEEQRMKTAVQRFRRCLLKLSCIAPPSMTKPRPMGASVHYAGTVPMRSGYQRLACSRECRSFDFPNLYFVDGSTFPSLPAKNLTFTLMANASRIATEAF